jgi:hypothetical protein
MKRIIHATFLLTAVVAFASCSKVAVVIDTPATVVGSWVVTDASRQDAHSWYSISSGVENGVFHFYNDGSAEYDEQGTRLQGTWNYQTVYSGYYDASGKYYNGAHKVLSINVSNYAGTDVIDMDLDVADLYGDSLVGTTYTNSYVDFYQFRRY